MTKLKDIAVGEAFQWVGNWCLMLMRGELVAMFVLENRNVCTDLYDAEVRRIPIDEFDKSWEELGIRGDEVETMVACAERQNSRH